MPIVEPDWSEVVRETGPALLRYFCGSFDRPRAADLVQETLIRLVQKHRQGSFSAERGTHKAYALGIARYVRLEALKTLSGLEFFVEDIENELRMNSGHDTSAAESGVFTSGAGTTAHSNVGVSTTQNARDDIRDLRRAIARLKHVEQEIILWTVDNFANPNLVVRYIPVLREVLRPLSVDNLPIAGQGIAIADNEGYLWVDNLDFNGKYVGGTTHRGTLVLSYSPFRGGSELG